MNADSIRCSIWEVEAPLINHSCQESIPLGFSDVLNFPGFSVMTEAGISPPPWEHHRSSRGRATLASAETSQWDTVDVCWSLLGWVLRETVITTHISTVFDKGCWCSAAGAMDFHAMSVMSTSIQKSIASWKPMMWTYHLPGSKVSRVVANSSKEWLRHGTEKFGFGGVPQARTALIKLNMDGHGKNQGNFIGFIGWLILLWIWTALPNPRKGLIGPF